MHYLVFWITLLLVTGLAFAFFIAINSSTQTAAVENVQRMTGRIRGISFWVLLIVGIGVLYATLTPWPHSGARAAKDGDHIVVPVTGEQWSWKASRREIPVGKSIIFAVSVKDVNHGLGIYDENYRLLTQVQGMPGYVNQVEYTFTKPGTYKLLCMEYCGISHHDMVDEIVVKEK